MTCPTKCQRQAKQQWASKVKAFGSGFIQDLDIALNLDYHPESDVKHHDSDTDSLVSKEMPFTLMNNSNTSLEDGTRDSNNSDDNLEESDAEITCKSVSKQQRTGSHE